jgi:scyllo-inositol 2-dehydrogenase (NADP+)
MPDGDTVRIAVVGLGKMGVSHLAIANATQGVTVAAICDSSSFLGNMTEKYTGLPFEADFDQLITRSDLDAVIIATPSRYHADYVRSALRRGLHVLCEKPMTLSSSVSDELAKEGLSRNLVCQVGYHNRFVGTFAEVKRLIEQNAIGRIRHVHAEAYGPVVLKPVAKTWRSKSNEGGGCLYDYAAHPINLMNWYVGRPLSCTGADLTSQYSAEVDDAVYANLHFAGGISGQVSVNWSDESMRKMTTRITLWGDKGKIVADRQELQLYVNSAANPPEGYNTGWTVKYITDLTPETGYYLRGEEYSAQIESFASAVAAKRVACVNDFSSAADTDFTLDLIRARNVAEVPHAAIDVAHALTVKPRGIISRLLRA